MAQLHSREAKGVVQQNEWKDRREARQKNDLPALVRHRAVNGRELLVLLDLPRDGIARQIAADQKCGRGAECCADSIATDAAARVSVAARPAVRVVERGADMSIRSPWRSGIVADSNKRWRHPTTAAGL